MTRITGQLRSAVRDRAAGRCEYCRLPDRLQIGGFEVDHIAPASRGGPTALDNLAYACPHCNDRKWVYVEAADPDTGDTVPLFNPRQHRWPDHFQWSTTVDCQVDGRTAVGRATVACLQLNHPELIVIRRELVRLGIPMASHDS